MIISGAGLDDGRGYARLAAPLASTCRVLRITRRRYRADLERSRVVEVADEAAERHTFEPGAASGSSASSRAGS